MGLLRAGIITAVCVFVLNLWNANTNPLPKSKKNAFEKYLLLALIFVIELVL